LSCSRLPMTTRRSGMERVCAMLFL
jgi:hypothetical protein